MNTKILCSFLVVAFVAISAADTVTTKDGSVLQGTVESVIDGKVTLKTAYAGVITIALDQVAKIETSASMPVHLKDGSVIVGTLMPAEDGVKVKRAEDQSEIPAAIGDITAVNPPAKPPVKWTGSVVGSLLVTGGNTENTGSDFMRMECAVAMTTALLCGAATFTPRTNP